jgi:hypothetical protein
MRQKKAEALVDAALKVLAAMVMVSLDPVRLDSFCS